MTTGSTWQHCSFPSQLNYQLCCLLFMRGPGDESNTGNSKLATVSAPSHFHCCGFEDRESQISCSPGSHWRCVLQLNWAFCSNCYSSLVTLKSFSLIFPLWTSWCIRWLLNPWTSEVEHSCDSKGLTHRWRMVIADSWSWDALLRLFAAQPTLDKLYPASKL